MLEISCRGSYVVVVVVVVVCLRVRVCVCVGGVSLSLAMIWSAIGSFPCWFLVNLCICSSLFESTLLAYDTYKYPDIWAA